MSIRTSFNPLGTLGAHGFPLPAALTRGLIDAVVSGYDVSWNNRIVYSDMHMDVEKSASALLKAETVIARIGETINLARVIVAGETDYYHFLYYKSGTTYEGCYLCQANGRRQTVALSAKPGDVVACTNIQKRNENAIFVCDNKIAQSELSPIVDARVNNVSFSCIDKAFFFDYVMTADEMKKKISLVENLQL